MATFTIGTTAGTTVITGILYIHCQVHSWVMREWGCHPSGHYQTECNHRVMESQLLIAWQSLCQLANCHFVILRRSCCSQSASSHLRDARVRIPSGHYQLLRNHREREKPTTGELAITTTANYDQLPCCHPKKELFTVFTICKDAIHPAIIRQSALTERGKANYWSIGNHYNSQHHFHALYDQQISSHMRYTMEDAKGHYQL